VLGIGFELRRIRRLGLSRVSFKLSDRALKLALWFVLLPLTLALHLRGYRRVTVFTDRIGHLAIEPDCLLKEEALGLLPRRRWFILAPRNRVANRHLLNYWRPLIRVHDNPAICFILGSMSSFRLMRQDVSRYLQAARPVPASYRIFNLWKDRPPVLELTPEDKGWGARALHQLGLPERAWFVCIHVREPGFSPIDEELQAHRNGSIEACIPGIEEIVKRGGWVIRIGDPSMRRLPEMLHVIDYAHHPMKSERLDIILCATARFILGNTSGIALVGSIFGIPCAAANMIPITTLWFNSRDISIPKLLWSEQLARYLRLDEILQSPVAQYRYASLYAKAGIRIEENSAEDIADLTREMLDRLDGTFAELPEDEEHWLRVLSHFRRYRPVESCARNGALFLRKHAQLLG